MVCENCGCKMACRYSAPAGARVRYRGYRCHACKGYLETVELAVGAYEVDKREEVLALVGVVKRQQQRFVKRK